MHDIHFLERLPRANYAETEMALSLYRDAELVRALLDRAAAPEAERIAIALGPGLEPSWLIVARDGGFVTCLGSGMDPGELPRVTHDTVKGLATRFDELRARLAYWDSCTESGGEMRRLIRGIFEAGERLSRESMRDLVPIAPLIWPYLYCHIPDLDRASREILLEDGERLLRRRNRLSSRDIEQLHCLWHNEWAKGHIALLLGSGHREIRALADTRPELTEGVMADLAGVTLDVGRLGFLPHVIRGIWYATQFGKAFVRPLKERLKNGGYQLVDGRFTMPTLSLTGIGMRYDKVRAEIIKTLTPSTLDTPQSGLRQLCAMLLNLTPEERTALHVERRDRGAKSMIASQLKEPWDSLPPDDQRRLLDFADVIACNLPVNAWSATQILHHVVELMPWFVSRRPEEFQLPRADQGPSWSPTDTLSLLVGLAPVNRSAQQPVQAAPKQGRNDPCACGSGKKFKRCCGA